MMQVLQCLKGEQIPLLYVYSDGAKGDEDQRHVAEVREILKAIDWCKTIIVERDVNYGLGRSIVSGVNDVLASHDSAIVFEDDLICVPGTYKYLSAALDHYSDYEEVMSVTGWTHPRVIPRGVGDQPYWDGRAECWVWGTWARAWKGMEQSASALIAQCEREGLDPYEYGADLPSMAAMEARRNIWAVKFLYLHMIRKGLCLRPPWSMVEHIGFDVTATNAPDVALRNPPLKPCPPLPAMWPEPREHRGMRSIWQKEYGGRPSRIASLRRLCARCLRQLYKR